MRDRFREQIAIAELGSNEAHLEETDVEGILAFADHVMANALSLWVNAPPEGKRAIQTALFLKVSDGTVRDRDLEPL